MPLPKKLIAVWAILPHADKTNKHTKRKRSGWPGRVKYIDSFINSFQFGASWFHRCHTLSQERKVIGRLVIIGAGTPKKIIDPQACDGVNAHRQATPALVERKS